MHELIASPFLDHHLVLRPGSAKGLRIPRRNFEELQARSDDDRSVPRWLADAAKRQWSLDLPSGPQADSVLVRPRTAVGYGRASYELNLGCNYDCPFCYLGLKQFDGLGSSQREDLVRILRDAGVLWLQLTGGEPMIDPGFLDVYAQAYRLGMMISISTNGSRLHQPTILEALTAMPPYRITVSIYGATAKTYDATTQRKGSFKAFSRGLDAAHEAGLPLRFNIIVTTTNDHELPAMQALADRFEAPSHVYSNIAPTIYGGAESLPAQSAGYLKARKPFGGCHAGHTFFHVDPHGKASICKVGRDPYIDLLAEGTKGLKRLGGIADGLMLRTGGCSGCTLAGSCWTCRPLAKLYQAANSPLERYCQHRGR